MQEQGKAGLELVDRQLLRLSGVNNVDVFDVFNNIEECKKSVAFKITYQDISKTLTDEEVTKSFENIISCVSKEYNGVLRNK